MTDSMKPIDSPYLAATDGSFKLSDFETRAADEWSSKKSKKALSDVIEDIAALQHKFYAHDRFCLLLVFQAMDAAGKDSTIRNVLSGVNPAGFEVHSFKRPSSTELDHDFLWRTTRALPQRGRIGVFNRSQYEEVLVVRVHPEILKHQKLPDPEASESLWRQRLESIADQEKHLAHNGTVIVKFFLNVSREEQRQRFLARLEDPKKRWKFEPNDVKESQHWDDYMQAYEAAISATSKSHAPWYAVPADNKPMMRYIVADIVRRRLASLPIKFPDTDPKDQPLNEELHKQLSAKKY